MVFSSGNHLSTHAVSSLFTFLYVFFHVMSSSPVSLYVIYRYNFTKKDIVMIGVLV